MGQMERALNRQYGIEQDRPTVQKYGRALLLALTAGVLSTAAFAMFALGHGIGQGLHDKTVTDIWKVVRWPIALVLMMAAIALLFRWSPNRHQPAWSWLAFGSTVSVVLWSLATLGLGLFFQASTTFSTTYGPLAGMIALAALGAAVVDRDPVRGGDRGAARSGARGSGIAEGRAQGGVGLGAGLAGAGRHRERERARHGGGLTMSLTDWFLTPEERGNPATELDRRHDDGTAWTEGNAGTILIDGAEYFARLHEVLCECDAGDWVCFTDWQGDPDELLDGPGTEVGTVLADLVGRGVNVRGLLWRSHPEAMNFGEAKNLSFSRRSTRRAARCCSTTVCGAAAATTRSSSWCSTPILRVTPRSSVASICATDGATTTRTTAIRRSWSSTTSTTASGRRGTTCSSSCTGRSSTTWRGRSPSAGAIPTRSTVATRCGRRCTGSRATPTRRVRCRRRDRRRPTARSRCRCCAPIRRGVAPIPFAPEGERSIARAYLKAFSRARRLVYLEDQYLWSLAATEALRDALAHNPELQVAIVVPRYPDPDGAISGEASRIGRERVLDALHEVGHERVAVYDVENDEGTPIYVHSKVCIIDDVWMAVGSDNLNRRSWTHDSELSCSVIDSRRDGRAPTDPAGLGDGARVLARDTRIRLAAEHLGRAPDDVDDLVDPASWFEALRKGAHVARLLAPPRRGGGAPARPPA